MDVLIVDDDLDLAGTLRDALADLGLVSTHAPDGAAALLYLRGCAHLPRLVLLDLRMNGIDGWSVLHEMRTDPALRSLPVVIMTGSWERADRGTPVVAYLKKPFSLDDVRAITVRALRLRDPLSELA